MVPNKQGLIVNITSLGGTIYLFNVPYGVGKAGVDRMVMDCSIELKKHNITYLGLMVGATKTETIKSLHEDDKMNQSLKGKEMKKMFNEGCTIEFPGKCLVSLANEKKLLKKYSGKIIIAEDYAQLKGINDIDGRRIPSFRQLNSLGLMNNTRLPTSIKTLTSYLPDFVKIPKPLLTLMTTKFY